MEKKKLVLKLYGANRRCTTDVKYILNITREEDYAATIFYQRTLKATMSDTRLGGRKLYGIRQVTPPHIYLAHLAAPLLLLHFLQHLPHPLHKVVHLGVVASWKIILEASRKGRCAIQCAGWPREKTHSVTPRK